MSPRAKKSKIPPRKADRPVKHGTKGPGTKQSNKQDAGLSEGGRTDGTATQGFGDEESSKKKKDKYCCHRQTLIYKKLFFKRFTEHNEEFEVFRLNGTDLCRPKGRRGARGIGATKKSSNPVLEAIRTYKDGTGPQPGQILFEQRLALFENQQEATEQDEERALVERDFGVYLDKLYENGPGKGEGELDPQAEAVLPMAAFTETSHTNASNTAPQTMLSPHHPPQPDSNQTDEGLTGNGKGILDPQAQDVPATAASTEAFHADLSNIPPAAILPPQQSPPPRHANHPREAFADFPFVQPQQQFQVPQQGEGVPGLISLATQLQPQRQVSEDQAQQLNPTASSHEDMQMEEAAGNQQREKWDTNPIQSGQRCGNMGHHIPETDDTSLILRVHKVALSSFKVIAEKNQKEGTIFDLNPQGQQPQSLPSAEEPGDATAELLASFRSTKLETPYTYLSGRFHPCLQLQQTLRRLRNDPGYDAQGKRDAEINMTLVEKLSQKEKDGQLVELFESDLQIPFVEINPERGILRDIHPYLKVKFGLDDHDDLLDSLRSNPYNQYTMRRFLKDRDPNYDGQLRWHLVETGMVFVLPCKPICRRYLTNSSSEMIHVLLAFGDFQGLVSIKVNRKRIERHTSMSEREARHGEYFVKPPYPAEQCRLSIKEPVAFVTPDCVVLCSSTKINESSVKAKKAGSKTITIEEFEHLEIGSDQDSDDFDGQEWEGLVLGYNLGYVEEMRVNGGEETIGVEPWEESTHVLGIPKLASPDTVHSLTLQSKWYRTYEHSMYESERLGENGIVEFVNEET